MGKGQVSGQISVLEEVACAAEASVWILYIRYKRQSVQLDNMNVVTSSDGARCYIQIPLGPSPAADNRRQLQIVCTLRVDNFPRYLICNASDSISRFDCKKLGKGMRKNPYLHTRYA